MKLVNTHISKDCTRKCLVYVDANGHYIPNYYDMNDHGGWVIKIGRKFKHIESLNRAVQKWVKGVR